MDRKNHIVLNVLTSMERDSLVNVWRADRSSVVPY